MKAGGLRQISVITCAEAETAVGTLLEELSGQPVSVYTDMGTKTAVASVYCSKQSDWSRGKRAKLAAGLRELRDTGLKVGLGRITIKTLGRKDWAESWKRHFKPIEIGPALLIKPSWSQRRPRRNQAVVVLDPGLSFGTGQHPTTSFCLEQLVAFRQPGRKQTFLDLGTGSGILAIAAVKLGYGPVIAIDFDPESIRAARNNAAENGVLRQIQFLRRDITRLPLHPEKPHDLICANLISNLLLAEQNRILNRLRPGGVLVLAGILETEFKTIRMAYKRAGLKLFKTRVGGEWQSGALRSTAQSA